MNIKAAIFDLNGTILSDEDEYDLAFKNVLSDLGVKTDKLFVHERGIGVKENWENFKSRYRLRTDKNPDELAVLTQQNYLKLLSRVKLRAGFEEFISDLRKRGIKTGLATSNTYSLVEKIFDKFEIEEYFDAITTAEEVYLNKPNPEIFIKTAEKLDIEPSCCCVFEDSKAGIKAAKNAGMISVGLARGESQRDLLKSADRIISSYKDFDIGLFNSS
jgi:HAD superfamily hydrolase (TIGR01509 family)